MSKKKISLTKVPKLQRNGETGVVRTNNYGAGWSTWANDDWAALLSMHCDIVQAVSDKDYDEAARLAKSIVREVTKDPKAYVCVLGAKNLVVEWVDIGSHFEILEYDGLESLSIVGKGSYLTA